MSGAGVVAGIAGAGSSGMAGAAKYAGITSGMKQVFGAAKNVSWIMIVVGMAHYIFMISYGYGASAISFTLSLLLFILGGYAVAAKADKDQIAVLIPMLIFIMWWFVFGGSYEPTFLIYFGIISALLLILPALFTKGKSITPELLGMVPVIFLFLDLGLIPFLIEHLGLPITSLLQNLVLFMPWWAFLGLLTLPSEVSKNGTVNFLVNLTRIIGIFYIIFIFIAPAIPNVGYDDSFIPEAGELVEAREKLRGQYAKKENPAWSNLVCMWDDFQNVKSCVQKRQEESELKFQCEFEEKKKPGTKGFKDCVKQKKEEKKNKGKLTEGTIDTTIKEPTKAKIVPDYSRIPSDHNPEWGYGFEIEVKNPRNLDLKAEVFCNFSKKTGKNKGSFLGKIEPAGMPIEITGEEFNTPFICYPPDGQKLNGSYSLNYGLKLIDMETLSRLQRAFVKDMSTKELNLLKKEEINKVIKIKESQSPKEFARINFDFGHTTGDPVIEGDPKKSIKLKSSIENVGGGRIIEIKSYNLGIEGFSFIDSLCVSGGGGDIQVSKSKLFPLKTCMVKDYPADLKNPEEWVPKTYVASLIYDYEITKKMNLNVKPKLLT